jgi:tetratricopeptide (TPR) repeat protein
MKLGFMCADAVWVELLAGDAAAAVALAAEASAHLEAVGLRNPDLTVDCARALYAAGRTAEAASALDRAEALTGEGDIVPRFTALQLRARLLADRGDHAAAEQLARDAVAIAETTDMLDYRGTALADLAEVLVLAGKPGEAAAALELALERYERKGILVEAERTRERLATLTSARTGC